MLVLHRSGEAAKARLSRCRSTSARSRRLGMVEDRVAETDQGQSADGVPEEVRDSGPKQNCGRPEAGGAIRCDPHDSTR
jgi:hypothetical protein